MDISIHNLAALLQPDNPSGAIASIFCLAYHHIVNLSLDQAPISGANTVSLVLRNKQIWHDEQATIFQGCQISLARYNLPNCAYAARRNSANIEILKRGPLCGGNHDPETALFAAELYFVSENAPAPSNIQAETKDTETHLSLSDYPETLVAVARYRLEVICPLLAMQHRTRVLVGVRVQEIEKLPTQSPVNIACKISLV